MSAPAAARTSERAFDAVLFLLCAAVLLAAVVLDPSREAVSLFGFEIPSMCTFRNLTGMRCPGCGLTRSFTFLAHGQLLEAFHMNPLGPVFFTLVASQVPYRLLRLIRRNR